MKQILEKRVLHHGHPIELPWTTAWVEAELDEKGQNPQSLRSGGIDSTGRRHILFQQKITPGNEAALLQEAARRTRERMDLIQDLSEQISRAQSAVGQNLHSIADRSESPWASHPILQPLHTFWQFAIQWAPLALGASLPWVCPNILGIPPSGKYVLALSSCYGSIRAISFLEMKGRKKWEKIFDHFAPGLRPPQPVTEMIAEGAPLRAFPPAHLVLQTDALSDGDTEIRLHASLQSETGKPVHTVQEVTPADDPGLGISPLLTLTQKQERIQRWDQTLKLIFQEAAEAGTWTPQSQAWETIQNLSATGITLLLAFTSLHLAPSLFNKLEPLLGAMVALGITGGWVFALMILGFLGIAKILWQLPLDPIGASS